MLHLQLTKELKFREAFDIWLSHRIIETHGQVTDASYIAPKTEKDYKANAKALEKFFGMLRLDEIHPGHLMEYQRARALCDRSVGQWAKPASANCVRKEIALLVRILQGVGVWGEEQEKKFLRLRAVESDVPRAMNPEEQHRWLHMSASREEWKFIYCYSILGLQTTGSTKELRTLFLGDIMLHDRFIQIRAGNAKNRYRVRTIPLVSEEVIWALQWLIERARGCGAHLPSHRLFPLYKPGVGYLPDKPMSEWGLARRWSVLRNATGLPWFKPNNLRHTALTRMAEAGIPIAVMMSFAGHISARMTQHYTTISQQAKRGWAEAVWARGASQPASASVPDFARGFGPQAVPAGPWQVRSSREA